MQPWEINECGKSNMYYFGAWSYRSESNIPFWWDDPAIARWLSVDPMISMIPTLCNYNYVYNNPIKFINIFGLGASDDKGK